LWYLSLRKKFLPYCKKDGLEERQISFLIRLISKLGLRGKTVLEIGGHNIPSEVIFNILGIKKYVCVDFISGYWSEVASQQELGGLETEKQDYVVYPLKEANSDSVLQSHSYLKFDGNAEYIPESFYGQFDAVISDCAFEHIQNLPTVVEQIYRCLRSGGSFYTRFGPLWSACCGHHYWLDENINFKKIKRDGIPSWIHLLWSEKQIRQHFTEHPLPYGEKQLEALIHYCFNSDVINHQFYEDYERVMHESSFENYSLEGFQGRFGKTSEEKRYLQELQEKYPGYARFDFYGIRILATK
jgi:SAM-dependent methyltransferase